LLLLFSPHDDARNCGLLSFIHPFISAAAVVLLGFLQNREYKKRAKLSFERSVFCFVQMERESTWGTMLFSLGTTFLRNLFTR